MAAIPDIGAYIFKNNFLRGCIAFFLKMLPYKVEEHPKLALMSYFSTPADYTIPTSGLGYFP